MNQNVKRKLMKTFHFPSLQLGRTPLHYAVVGNHPDTVDLLVFCGADANIENKVSRYDDQVVILR